MSSFFLFMKNPATEQPPPATLKKSTSTPNSENGNPPNEGSNASGPPSKSKSTCSNLSSSAAAAAAEPLPEPKELEQENRRLKEQRLCKICMDNDVGVVFLPCGHLICCTLCAPALKDCPLCRQMIQGTVKTYMS